MILEQHSSRARRDKHLPSDIMVDTVAGNVAR
jgi:hypothetical protein